jgi:TM2 domain-containing membrane protein YozV
MKKIHLSFLFAISILTVYGQDYIIKKDGGEIQAKVLEVGTSEIKYKQYNNQDGPVIAIRNIDVVMIRYQNGTNHIIQSSPTNYSSNQSYQSNNNSAVPLRYQGVSRREPYLAVLFSGLFPGGGQYYNKQVGKGVAASVIGVTGLTLMMVGVSESSYIYDYDYYDYDEYLDDLEYATSLIAAGSVIYSLNWLWSTIDAGVTATKLNRDYGLTFSVKPIQYQNMVSNQKLSVGPTLTIKF